VVLCVFVAGLGRHALRQRTRTDAATSDGEARDAGEQDDAHDVDLTGVDRGEAPVPGPSEYISQEV